ncbi:MAG: amidohydrolase family protein [bacterium]
MSGKVYNLFRFIAFISIALLGFQSMAYSQPLVQSKAIDGLRDKPLKYLALTQCTLIPQPGRIIRNATIIIRNDRIEAAGAQLSIPVGATVRSMNGAFVYAGFIESYSSAGSPGGSQKRGFSGEGEDEIEKPASLNRGARYWNEAIKPEMNIANSLGIDEKSASELYKQGFCIAHVNSMDGIMRGTSALVFAKTGSATEVIIKPDISQWMSFRKGNARNAYPSSLMGSIALIRQAFLDGRWYAEAQNAFAKNPKVPAPETNFSLEAIAGIFSRKTPIVFETGNEHAVSRVAKIAKEFDLNVIYEGSGYEYRRLSQIASLKAPMIIPLSFPNTPNVQSLRNASGVSLAELKAWDVAPSNPALLESAGVKFAFTMNGLKDKSEFLKQLRKAIRYGLKEETALAALTTIPAELWGAEDFAGTIKPGAFANLVIADGNIFTDGSITSVFVAGEEHVLQQKPEYDIRGHWRFTAESLPKMQLQIEGKVESPSAHFMKDSTKIAITIQQSGKQVHFAFDGDSLGAVGSIRCTGFMDSLNARGSALLPTGREITWSAVRDSGFVEKPKQEKEGVKLSATYPIVYPDGPFGLDSKPAQKSVMFKNATVWTSAKDGILKGVDVFISGGKIMGIAKDLQQKADTVIDATGKHLAPGIIDEHSHIAIEAGVNEGTHAITAEVRIGDVLQPDDINIYRQLAGGVTASHLLHGSANPIGGQLQLIKLRWGDDADGLKMDFPGTIKFALGENVKQANWGDRFTSRYPQTRMGVEEIMRDGFRAALEYEKAWKEAGTSGKLPPRKDIQLETLLEIIRGKRQIHCHSYVQSEILMLMRLAEEFGFKINTFTHILEGYKLAKEMQVHGVGASSFSDWWAYKFEVYDAIPENAPIMHEQGVTVAINSDDAEMARRLNQEAGKSVKYGPVSEEEAMKFVTINPAKLLKVDDRIGSIEVGKDADIVLWTGNPLSNFSKVEQTYVDGRKYFDRKTDEQLRKRDASIRTTLEQKALQSNEKGDGGKGRFSGNKHLYDCEDIADEVAGFEGE